jgi:hypothetical protein
MSSKDANGRVGKAGPDCAPGPDGKVVTTRGHDAIVVFVDRLSTTGRVVACSTSGSVERRAEIFDQEVFKHHGLLTLCRMTTSAFSVSSGRRCMTGWVSSYPRVMVPVKNAEQSMAQPHTAHSFVGTTSQTSDTGPRNSAAHTRIPGPLTPTHAFSLALTSPTPALFSLRRVRLGTLLV